MLPSNLLRLPVFILFLLPFASRLASAQTNFGQVNLGSSASSTVTVQIPAASTLTGIAVVTQGAPNLDFTNAGGGSCTTTVAYPANQTCTVQVTFTPQFSGTRYGAVVLADAAGVVATAWLQGTGHGPQITFQPGAQNTIASFTPEFTWTSGAAVDGSGNVYLTNYDRFGCGSAQLVKETLSGGSYIQSVVPTSTMSCPYGVAVDGAGNIYVADTSNWRVLKETPIAGGYAETIVASFPAVDGTAPIGVAVDGGGDIFISLGSDGGSVVEETPAAGGYTETTVVSGLCCVAGVAVDGSGSVYAAVNQTNGWIGKETPTSGRYNETIIPVTGEGVPFAVAVDGSGNVYVAFIDNNDVGQVFKEAVTAGGYSQSTIPTLSLDQPGGVAVDGSGNVYIADSYNYRALKENLSVPPSLNFATTALGSTSSDSPQSVTVSNIGNADLPFSSLSFPADFPEDPNTSGNCASAASLLPGTACAISIDFSPVTPLDGASSALLSESVELTSSAVPHPQYIPVAGIETTASSFSINGTPISVVPGATTGNTSTVTLTPSGGFTGAISLSCAITPIAATDPATCSIPASVTISSSAAQTTILTVSTTPPTISLNRSRPFLPASARGTALACILLIGLPFRRRRWASYLVILVLAFFSLGSALGCTKYDYHPGHGSVNPGTTPGAYSITITGISGAITQTASVALTVQ